MAYAPGPVATWCIFSSSASRRAALELDQARHMLRLAPAKIAADPGFPRWYAKRYAERWRFASTRLALQQEPANIAFALTMAGRTALDRWIIKTAARCKGRLARILILAWLWLRLRPYRLSRLAATFLYRKIMWSRENAALRGGDHRRRSARIC